MIESLEAAREEEDIKQHHFKHYGVSLRNRKVEHIIIIKDNIGGQHKVKQPNNSSI
jgi:hypothetical protein